MARTNSKPINLALQGGGAHGAFAWGVLDCLLEDGRLEIEGVTAASAGAMNAVLLAHGLTSGGADGARATLHSFWEKVSEAGRFSPVASHPMDQIMPGSEPIFTYLMFDLVTKVASPYQFNPFNFNPLLEIIQKVVDFEAIRKDCAIQLYLSATNVRSGKIRVFESSEITADHVMASSCLPFLFHAVEIDGEAYWDGGYMGNPAIFPIIYKAESSDILIVHLNPMRRDEVPKDSQAILNRINEISFNSSLMREMRAIAFVTDLIEHDQIRGRPLKKMLVHSIGDDEFMVDLGLASKLNPEWTFLTSLRDAGREATGEWLEQILPRWAKSRLSISEKYFCDRQSVVN